ncbi:nucleotidyltransferase family protein [Paenibacillus hexagrammi]|uniref:Nucleotidyltransferase family protein n=1 Tax=Paenibacillus hexagrammi TaxID=2908839 RepID=A0ABY3SCZ7_9BACL|nr:nucleotidyltransferase family protein [Paenibacillus sp. YPD9-1]UJF31863.1 nucleotidyltransferase family protein [Paenibacillus sp. YPD9-1]
MKAILMAAGLGTRLHPITTHTPKCMVLIKGVPLLGWWLQKLKAARISEVIINLHHLPDQVIAYVNSQDWGLPIHFAYEQQLLGSMGTLAANRHFLQGEPSFLVVYADNLTDIDLNQLVDYHDRHQLVGTISLFESEHPEMCGIVQMDAQQVVVEFTEKPAVPRSKLANAGIYIFNDTVWKYIRITKQPSDIGYDLLPHLIGLLSGYLIEGFFMDMGTLESLEKGSRCWSYDYQSNATAN